MVDEDCASTAQADPPMSSQVSVNEMLFDENDLKRSMDRIEVAPCPPTTLNENTRSSSHSHNWWMPRQTECDVPTPPKRASQAPRTTLHRNPATVTHLAANLPRCHWLLTSRYLAEVEEARLAEHTTQYNVCRWTGTAGEESQRAMHTQGDPG